MAQCEAPRAGQNKKWRCSVCQAPPRAHTPEAPIGPHNATEERHYKWTHVWACWRRPLQGALVMSTTRVGKMGRKVGKRGSPENPGSDLDQYRCNRRCSKWRSRISIPSGSGPTALPVDRMRSGPQDPAPPRRNAPRALSLACRAGARRVRGGTGGGNITSRTPAEASLDRRCLPVALGSAAWPRIGLASTVAERRTPKLRNLT